MEEARTRLAKYTQSVYRILTAARYQPSDADRIELLKTFLTLVEELLALVTRRVDSDRSVFTRNIISRQLSGPLSEARRLAKHEFEVMLLECVSAAPSVAASSTTYIFLGHNARVNNQSVDASTNVVKLSETELFSHLQRALDGMTDLVLRDRLCKLLATLRGASDATMKRVAYAEFVTASTQTPSVQPLMSALTHWLTQ